LSVNAQAVYALLNKDGIFRMGVDDSVIGETSGEKPPIRFWPKIESSVTEQKIMSKIQRNFENIHGGLRLRSNLNKWDSIKSERLENLDMQRTKAEICSRFNTLTTTLPGFATQTSPVKVNQDDSSTSGSELEQE